MAQRIIIMAGGTGGHVFPALAVAQYLQESGWQVSWLGTHKGLESRIVPAQGIAIDWLSVAGIRGKGVYSKLSALLGLIKACWQAFRVLRQRKPQVVLGMGGFVAGPGGLMARLMRIPLVIHEQNKIPGTTNRLLTNVTENVLEAFEGSFSPNVNAICTGNPLRKELIHWTQRSDRPSHASFHILIIGGSQGAAILNTTVPDALAQLTNIAVWHQTGQPMFEEVTDRYAKLGIEAKVSAFIESMRSAYEWADMIICRSGAMTVSEIAAVGLPAIFIPLPQAIDDHQVANAKVIADTGGALILLQKELNNVTLLKAIQHVQKNSTIMTIQAKSVARVNATKLVADICIARAKP